MQKYFTASGTAARSEYWGVYIISTVVYAIIAAVALGLIAINTIPVAAGMVMIISSITYMWVYLAVTARRCRDAGINVWWTAAVVIPYIGFIAAIVYGCIATDAKDTK